MREALSEVKSTQSIAPDARLVYNRRLKAGTPSAAGQLSFRRKPQPATTFVGPIDLDADG